MSETKKKIYKVLNEATPEIRERAGYYVNPLETALSYLNVPQQLLYTMGENLGKFIMQSGDTELMQDLSDSIAGRGNKSFRDVLKSVHLEQLDVSIPDGMVDMFDSTPFRWGVAGVTGVGLGFATANPFVGIASAISLNEMLQGKGVVSSVADVVLDPLNKVRLLPRTNKGLGITNTQFKALEKSGQLESFVMNGVAYIPKAVPEGQLIRNTDDIFSVTFKDADTAQKGILRTPAEHIHSMDGKNLIITGKGLDDLGKEAFKGDYIFTQIGKKGQFTGGFEKIEIEKTHSSFIGSLLSGERKLIDFKGSSGFIITPNTPFVGKYLIPKSVNQIDVGAPVGYVVKPIDFVMDNLGKALAEIPGRQTLANIEKKTLAKLTGWVSTQITKPFKSTVVQGGDHALKVRKLYEDVLADKEHPAFKKIRENLNKYAGDTDLEKLEKLEETFKGLRATQLQRESTLTSEANTLVQNSLHTLKEMPAVTIAGVKSSTLGQVAGEDVIKSIEAGFQRRTNLSIKELEDLNIDADGGWDTLFEALDEAEQARKNIGSVLLKNELGEKIQHINEEKTLRDLLANSNQVELLQQLEAYQKMSVVPTNFKLDALVEAEDLARKGMSEDGQILSAYAKATEGWIEQLLAQKKVLDEIIKKEIKQSKANVKRETLRQYDKQLKQIGSAIEQNILEDKILQKFLEDPQKYTYYATEIKRTKKAYKELIENPTKDVEAELLFATKLNDGIKKALELKNKQFLDLKNIPEAERKVWIKAIDLFGAKFHQQFDIVFDHAKTLGKVTDQDFVVAGIMKKMNSNNTSKLVLRMSESSDVRHGVSLLAEAYWEYMPDLMKNKIGVDRDTFLNSVINTILSPTPLNDLMPKQTKTIFGQIHDAFRKVLAYAYDIFGLKKFKNEDLQKTIVQYIKGTDSVFDINKDIGKNLQRIEELIDASGNIKDPLRMKETLDRVEVSLKEAGLMGEHSGIDVGLDGLAWSPLVYKDLESFKELRTRAYSLKIDMNNRLHIGAKELIDWQVFLKQNPSMVDMLLQEEVVPPKLMELFLAQTDFTNKANPNSIISNVVYSIANAFEIIPYESFADDFGLLFRSQINVLKGLEAIPVVNFLKKNLDFLDIDSVKEIKNKHIYDAFVSFNIEQNDSWKALLVHLNAFLEQAPTKTATDDIKNIRNTLRKGRLSVEEFTKLGDDIKNIKDQEIQLKLMNFMYEFVERDTNEFNQIVTKTKLLFSDDEAQRLIEEMATKRIDALMDTGEKSTLDSIIGQFINRANRDPAFKENALDIADTLNKNTVGQMANKGKLEYADLLDSNGQISKMKGFETFRAEGKNPSPIARAFDGHLIPKSLEPLLKQDENIPYEKMSTIKQIWSDLLIGVDDATAKQRGKDATNVINKALGMLPFGNKMMLGEMAEERFTKLFQNLNYSYFLNLFKSHSLLSTAFHSRNFLSAYYVNTVHGVDNGSSSMGIKAAWNRNKYHSTDWGIDREGNIYFKNPNLTKQQRDEITLLEEGKKAGILGGGMSQEINADIARSETRRGGWFDIHSLDWGVLRKNFEVAGVIEDSVRLGAFKYARDILNYSIEEAGNYVKLLHFDYNLLTEFEKTYMKKLIPFYTYTRKALARDSRLFVERTGTFVRTSNLINSVEYGNGAEKEEAISSFVKDNLGVNVHVDDKGRHYYLLLGGLIPTADIVMMMKDVKDIANMEVSNGMKELAIKFMQNMTPYLKIPIEHALNFDFYFKKPVRRVQGEYADLFGYEVDADTAYYLNQVRWLRDLGKVARGVFDMPFAHRPDLPKPSETSLGMAKPLLSVLGGINIVENATPNDFAYFNKVLPLQRQRQELRNQIAREARRGGLLNPNYSNAVRLLREFDEKNRDEFIEKKRANVQIMKKLNPQ